MCHKFNASVLQNIINHAIGCYPCLFCIIGSDEMATPLSIRGYATRRTLETMYSDHQHYVAAGSIRRDAQKFLIASHCLYSISQFHRYRYMYKVLNLTYSSQNIGLPTWSPHYTGYLYQAVSFAGSCMPSAGPGASFAYNRFYLALFQLFKVQPGASKPLFPPS